MTKNEIRTLLRTAKKLDDISTEIKRKVIDTVDADSDLIHEIMAKPFNPEEAILSLKYGDYPNFDNMYEGYELDVPKIGFDLDKIEFKFD